MLWFFRVIEGEDGSWSCRRGREVLDEHPTLGDALSHLYVLAQASQPASLFAHYRDGRVEKLGDVAIDTT
jgi:hypothetical protein